MRQHSKAAMVMGVALLFLVNGIFAAGQTRPTEPPNRAAISAPGTSIADRQTELLKLLRLTPRLATVVVRDPSLLSNQEYVSRNNPELGQFLQSHPEVARNPEFYLFTNLGGNGANREEALERKMWPEMPYNQPELRRFEAGPYLAFLAFLGFLGAILWLLKFLLENRRWGRVFKLQSEVHGKLIDKFAGSQELLTYMGTEAGKRFLEAAPIPVDFEHEERMPSPVARVLTPLQVGIVLALLGIGSMSLRSSIPEGRAALMLLGVLALMVGLGFIISAATTWVLARRLGLIPQNPEELHGSDTAHGPGND